MNHNYTVLITGTLTETQEEVEQHGLATFAFADNNEARCAELKLLAAEAIPVRLDCPSCVMMGRLEFVEESDAVSLFHFHLDELRANG